MIDGLPLWKSNDFRATNPISDHTHYHQRSDANPYDMPATYATLDQKRPRRMPPQSEGQYMSYRVPIQRTTADYWIAECVGNRNEVERLLTTYLNYVGKKTTQGYGRVASWEVEEMSEFDWRDRPIPIQSERDILAHGSATLCGWTPPYSLRSIHRLCAN